MSGARGSEPAPHEPLTSGQRQEAFRRHVTPELGILLHVARTMTKGEHDAEDLVQETLLRAYRSIESFDGRHPRAWLFTIMRNAQINRTRRRRPELLDDPRDAENASADNAALPEDLVEGRLFRAAVVAALSTLPRRMREVAELVDMDGLTYPEAATALGVPVGTVMSRLHRARRRIRDQLLAEGIVQGRASR